MCAKAVAAQQFIRDGLPCTPAVHALLWDYLGALTREMNLRRELAEAQVTLPVDLSVQTLLSPEPFPVAPQLWLALLAEQRQTRRELEARLTPQAAQTATALAALRQADVQVAQLVALPAL